MKGKTMKYELLGAEKRIELNEKVNIFLEKGWVVYSAPIVILIEDGRVFFYQAVVFHA